MEAKVDSKPAARVLAAMIVPVTAFQQNCTVLWCTKSMRAVVIDPGGDLDRVRAAIAESKAKVETIWLTHGHIDHAGGATELKESLGVPIVGPHVDDKFLLDMAAGSGLKFGIFNARNVAPDRWLNEGDKVEVGELSFDILHCPGHSPGSVAYANRAEKFAIVGDVLFRGSVGRTDLPRADHATLLASIRNKLLPLGDDMAFICGHGPGSTIGRERRSNPFLQ
jgi:glyoxylase-like metal-dependent hydrolase (beta-lactamase superfamily II)